VNARPDLRASVSVAAALRRVTILLLVGVLACVAAGCGEGDEASGEPDTVATDTVGTDVSGDFGSEEDCLALTYASDELELSFTVAASVRQGGFEPGDDFQPLVDRAPDEIRPDLEVLADAYRAYDAVLRESYLQAGQPPSPEQLLEQARASVDQEELTAAFERLSTWAEENCPQTGG